VASSLVGACIFSKFATSTTNTLSFTNISVNILATTSFGIRHHQVMGCNRRRRHHHPRQGRGWEAEGEGQ
jgi:hypothetical protein